ncbi:MAG: hypothetical protein ACOCW6_07945, partial [Spirochaetota bacterium]
QDWEGECHGDVESPAEIPNHHPVVLGMIVLSAIFHSLLLFPSYVESPRQANGDGIESSVHRADTLS